MVQLSPRAVFRPALIRAVGWTAAGLAVGGLWALLAPTMRGRSESYEQLLAGDVTLAVLVGVAGLGVAVHGLWRHAGPGATAYFMGSLLGSGIGSIVAWGTGRLLGAPVLVSAAVLLLWPMVIALVTVTWTLIATLVTREKY